MLANTNFQLGRQNHSPEEQYLCQTGRRFSALDFNKAPWEQVTDELSKVDWEPMEDIAAACPTKALKWFHEQVLAILEKLVPVKNKRSKSRPKMHRMRRLLWRRLTKVRKALKTATSTEKVADLLQRMWQLEGELSSDYTATNNRIEDEAVFKIKSNSKYFFTFAKSRQNTRAKVGPFLDDEGKPNPSADFAAESLRKQYDSVFAQPRDSWKVTDTESHFSTEAGEPCLQDISFSTADIEKACSELRGSAAAGPDGVPAMLLKNCRKHLSKPLHCLWRSSLDSGTIPVELLLVLICPVHKGGSRSIPKNYRPVALTSHLIKVFERVVRHALVAHLDRHGLLPDGQHGSRAMRSTLTQLLSHWDNILDGLEQGEGVDCVYLDFSKAFDKVETGVLLHKLKDAKVLGKVGCWLAAFLNSATRQQAVVVEGRISELSPVISGVPQGTVLGPILFLLHIADIARGVSSTTRTSSYVDDTRVSKSVSDPVADCKSLQDDLASIYSWADDVNMVFYSDKFECLRFWPGKTSKPTTEYVSPDGSPIEEKVHLRDLGVQIGTDMTFSIHIQNTISAANKLIGWALRTFRRRSRLVMITIWKSLVQTKLDYCSQLWSPGDQASISKLEGVAKHFTAQVAGLQHMDYWDRLAALHLYSQERRRERYQIIFIWKVLQGLVQGYNINTLQSPRRGRLVDIPVYKRQAPAPVRKARENSLSVKGARLFNLIPRDLREMQSGTVEQFKAKLDGWLSTLPDQPTIQGRQRAALTNSLLDQVVLLPC